MTLFPLFEQEAEDELAPQAARLAPKLRELTERGIYFGTSSWKYEGWLGSIYQPDRYLTRGKVSTKKFEDECLKEYAKVFPIVCGDFAFYQFPTPEYWKKLFESTPDQLLFAFKVPEDITVAIWPRHARYGIRSGLVNDSFLRADLFRTLFLKRLEPYRHRVACLILEFGTFNKQTFASSREFIEKLALFLGMLPKSYRYSVEIRNPEYLTSEYFDTLSQHNIAHVFNAWTRMPELSRQIEMPRSHTTDFSVVRALLKHGRAYADAVSAFEPYKTIQEPNLPAREAIERIAKRAIAEKQRAYIFVNNRMEGNAPSTIEEIIGQIV